MTPRRTAAVLLVTAVAIAAARWLTTRDAGIEFPTRADRNVLLITIDTLRADALSAAGGTASTPRLDGLAAGGARFTFAHSHAVVTLPSHASLLTGAYPYTHGVRDNNGYRLRAGTPTLASRLKPLGFATAALVGGFPLDQRFGLNSGFDVYDDHISEAAGSVDFALPERRADAVVSAAMAWTAGQHDKWFAWVHVFDPHAPYAAPEPFASRYPGNPYAAEVAWTDHALAPLFDRVAGLARPTLVVVTADHGESLGEHGELTHGIFAYEATLRVPLIVAEIGGGSSAARGVTIDSSVRHVDVVPTVLDVLGAPADASLAGTSLRGAIARGGGDDRPSYFEAMTATLSRGWAPLRGVIVGHDKYVDLPLPELYALERDPGEERNLATTERQRTEVLLNTLRQHDVAPPSLPGEETSAVRDRLRALGYVGGSAAARRERYEEADDPKRLIEIDALLHRAGDHYQHGRFRAAAALFQEAIARRRDTADAYRYLAFVYWQTGQRRSAIETLERALAQGLSHRDIRVKLGIYLAETGDAKRAIALLDGLTGDDIEALNALGIAYGQSNRPDDALKMFRKAIEIDPSNALAWQNIGAVELRAGRLGAAGPALKRALELDDRLAGAHTALGVLLMESGDRREALASWKRAVDADPRELDALYNLAVTLAQDGQTVEARAYAERYIALAPPGQFAPDIARLRALLGSR